MQDTVLELQSQIASQQMQLAELRQRIEPLARLHGLQINGGVAPGMAPQPSHPRGSDLPTPPPPPPLQP